MTSTPANDARFDRILDVAIELANEQGYAAVRLRDLAARADVALGTVYRRFGSKEDILAAVLERMVEQFSDAVASAPVPGSTPAERLGAFFALASQALSEQPKLAAAVFRTVASGEPEIAARVLRYRETMDQILLTVWQGEAPHGAPSPDLRRRVRMLQSVWFAELVGWTGGVQDVDSVIDQVQAAIELLCNPEEAP